MTEATENTTEEAVDPRIKQLSRAREIAHETERLRTEIKDDQDALNTKRGMLRELEKKLIEVLDDGPTLFDTIDDADENDPDLDDAEEGEEGDG